MFCSRLVEEYRPSRIVLFGSYARGKPRPDSDVDLLIVMPFKGSGVSKAAEMIRKLSPSFAVDLVIRTPTDIERRVAMNDFFLKEATSGKLLYEAPNA
ncbi:MAG: nucleotidyltransferase domain-containing protein [bacterium]